MNGRDRGSLGEHDQSAEQQHQHNQRHQPELLALAHEIPELGKEGHWMLFWKAGMILELLMKCIGRERRKPPYPIAVRWGPVFHA